MRAELFHEDRQMDRDDEASSRFSQFDGFAQKVRNIRVSFSVDPSDVSVFEFL